MSATDTWTLGPVYPVASCTRCGADADAAAVASGWCWKCGYLGAVEFKTPLEMQEDDMCPNCVTPWKCNGPHEHAV